MATVPAIIPFLAGLMGVSIVENGWLALWGLSAFLGGTIVVIGLTLRERPSRIAK